MQERTNDNTVTLCQGFSDVKTQKRCLSLSFTEVTSLGDVQCAYVSDLSLVVLAVYDVTRRETFAKLDNWLNELETYCTRNDLVKMLVGNKIDRVSVFVWLCLCSCSGQQGCLIREEQHIMSLESSWAHTVLAAPAVTTKEIHKF